MTGSSQEHSLYHEPGMITHTGEKMWAKARRSHTRTHAPQDVENPAHVVVACPACHIGVGVIVAAVHPHDWVPALEIRLCDHGTAGAEQISSKRYCAAHQSESRCFLVMDQPADVFRPSDPQSQVEYVTQAASRSQSVVECKQYARPAHSRECTCGGGKKAVVVGVGILGDLNKDNSAAVVRRGQQSRRSTCGCTNYG